MSDLSDVLRRAASFLDALPDDLPEPELRQDQPGMDIEFNWTAAYLQSVYVYVGIEPDLTWGTEGRSASEQSFAFDGTTVPPAIVAAIQRVTEKK